MKRLLRLLTVVAAITGVAAALRRRRQVHDGVSAVATPTPWTPLEEQPTPAAWVEPGADDEADYPVKAKVGSGIYHVPGGASYERTTADRRYRTPEAAEADGLRPAKR